MKTAAGWGVWLAVLVAAVGTGCGRQDIHPSPAVPETEQNDAPHSPPMEGPTVPVPSSSPIAELPGPVPPPPPGPVPTPPSGATPAAEWWLVNPEPTPITYEVPACLPVSAPTGTRFAHPCAVTRFGPDGWPVHFQRLDSGGTVVEEAAFSGGTRLWRRLDTYSHGHKVREDRWPGAGPSFFTTEWIYDASDRLVMEIRGDRQSPYLYDEAGRLKLVEHFNDDPELLSNWERSVYGSQGQLETIYFASSDYCFAGPHDSAPACGLYAFKAFTYHPTGQLKHVRYEHFSMYDQNYPFSSDEEYDAHGRPLSLASHADEGGMATNWAYDAQGRRIREHTVNQGSFGGWEQWTHWLYTGAGQPGAERIIREWDYPWSSPPRSGHGLKLNRYFYACGGEDLLFEEQDTNEDGVRDGWRELVRDAAGNLRVERYQGSLIQDARLSRVEYDYSCNE